MSKVIKRTRIDCDFPETPTYVVPTDRPELAVLEPIEDEFVPEAEDDGGLEAAEARAAEIIAGSRRKAEEILRDAMTEAESVARKAEAEGMMAGRAVGLEEVRAEYAEVLEIVQSAADDIVANADALVRGCEREIAQLAVAVAEKLIRKTLDEDPEAVLSIIREAVRRTEGSRSVVMRVSPEDLDVVAEAHSELMGLSPDLRSLKVVEDPRMERGGCVIEMEVGAIDARVDEQFREVERAFMEEAKYAG